MKLALLSSPMKSKPVLNFCKLITTKYNLVFTICNTSSVKTNCFDKFLQLENLPGLLKKKIVRFDELNKYYTEYH